MIDSPLGTSALVPTAVNLSDLPDCLIASEAPSMRGWMLRAPGVAMNPTTSPESSPASMACWPSANPDSYRPWPM
jgi:hypothetical protein